MEHNLEQLKNLNEHFANIPKVGILAKKHNGKKHINIIRRLL